jgi:glycerol-3-phosphate dehydrogenase
VGRRSERFESEESTKQKKGENIAVTRSEMLTRLRAQQEPWSFIVVGGGATGVGVAVDAAARGYRTLLLEQHDFGKGTSSRSTKLVHGGVRYLEQGNVSLVMEALKERGILRQNAPHLVSELPFVVPNYSWWEGPFYGIGLKLYQVLAGRYGFGASQILSREETLERLPNLNTDGLRGGVIYFDGQFDDSRLLINLVTTAVEQGAVMLNYMEVTSLEKDAEGVVNGVVARDQESGEVFRLEARVVINATGPFTDHLRRMAEPDASPMISPSQGAHIVLDHSFLPGKHAIMVPHTSDGRVMFAIPWHGHTLVGTTDTPVDSATVDPVPFEQEIDFMLSTAALYLEKKPTKADVLSTFAGIRPLVRSGGSKNTAALSRDHTLHIDQSGLVTITGGKWTTYRNMAEDCVDHAALLARLTERPSVTKHLNIHGYHQHAEGFGPLEVYGADAPYILDIIGTNQKLREPLHPALAYCGAEVIWAVRKEMARSVEDVLARRTRALILNAKAAKEMAPRVAERMASELGDDRAWQDQQVTAFTELAKAYLPNDSAASSGQ